MKAIRLQSRGAFRSFVVEHTHPGLLIAIAVLLFSTMSRGQTACPPTPTSSSSGPVISTVCVNGVQSNVGPVGATLTLQGSGFGNTRGVSTVTLGGLQLAGSEAQPKSWSSNSIVVTLPSAATSGSLLVKVLGKFSNAVTFDVGPVITGVSPGSALVGGTVDVLGAGFGSAAGTLTFNGVSATTTTWQSGEIVAVVPSGVTAGPVVVTTSGQASNGMPFTPTPQITSLLPNSGLSGATVTISGNSFGASQGASTVSFNGVAAAVSAWNNTSITVAAPSGALTGNVVVSVNSFSSAGQLFTYTPQISGLSPNPALADSTVQIQGINFNNQQGSSTVTFNGLAATVTNWSNTAIAATVPGNVTPGPVVVTVNGVASNGLTFSLPSLYSLSLGYAPNGDVLTANDSVNGNWTYSYDDFNRLATAGNSSPQQGFSYAYDQYGNRWQQNLTAGSGGTSNLTFTVNTALTNGNCYHAAGLNNQPDGFCHDAAGNLLNDGQHSYTYDAENRIISVDGGATAAYTYDAGGNRIQKVSTAGTAQYLYDLAGHVITELNASGTWTRGEIYAGGRHLATYGNGSSGTAYVIQADWLGTERTRVLPSGDLFETCVSLPFGDGLNCTGSADPSPDHLTGKQRDTESNLDYFAARYYSSSMGRFVNPDWAGKATTVPYANFGDPQTLNLYIYTRNIPTTLIDDDGHGIGTPDWSSQQAKARITQEANLPEGEQLKRAATGLCVVFCSMGAAMAPEATPLARGLLGLGLAAAPVATPIIVGALDAMTPGPSGTLTISAATRLTATEIDTGVRLAQQTGTALVQSEHVGAEFVDAAGKTYDAMGGGKAFKFFGDGSKFMDSIVSHVNKSVDTVAIDLQGASKSQIGAIKNFVKTLTEQQQKKVTYVN
jgi:RHS repeat-associated protein